MDSATPGKLLSLGIRLAFLAALGLLVACGGGSNAARSQNTSPSPSASPPALKNLKVEPEKGDAGDPFTITGEGLPANKTVEFVWVTVDGDYITNVGPENVEFINKTFNEKRLTLQSATTDAQGRVTASLTVPDDYGETHDIYAVIDGQDVAKGGYRIMRKATMSPQEGPLGTLATITVTGLGWKPFESTIALRYDNLPTGIITAVTTKGSATIQIRAAGGVGKHVIDLNHGARSVPYLNNQQSGTADIPDIRLWFVVTGDTAMPSDRIDWPDDSRVAKASDAVPRTAASGVSSVASLSATLDPPSGPILSSATLRVSGLSANTEAEVFWVTARGNRVSPTGWNLNETSLLKITSGADGSFSTSIQIPDDLGGWHVVKLVQGEKVLAEVPYYVERSLVGVTPKSVKAGDVFEVHIKGVGWTELDNGVAITYDNAYIGFACGFNSNGDADVFLVATGEPGIHLIDLYPMIYQGHGEPPWGYQQPILSYGQDAPGLALGYRLPAIRLAIEVVE